MANYNKCVLIGHLTRDPETAFTASNVAICKFGLAINHKRGEKKEVCFIDCVAFGKTGEVVQQYSRKGNALLVEGRVALDQWEDRDGNKRSKHKIVVDSVQFMGEQDKNAKPADDDDVPFA